MQTILYVLIIRLKSQMTKVTRILTVKMTEQNFHKNIVTCICQNEGFALFYGDFLNEISICYNTLKC